MPYVENERLRALYRPQSVRVLFIGESPPAGGTFFYAANSHLYRYTREAFARVYPEKWEDGPGFLAFFGSLGCFLDDLCLDPVNHLDPPERSRTLKLSVPSLAGRIQSAKPLTIVSMLTAIRRRVGEAAQQAGLGDVPIHTLPFPTHGNQRRYVTRLEEVLHELKQTGVLP